MPTPSHRRPVLAFAVAAFALSAGAASAAPSPQADAFFARLGALCGKTFGGYTSSGSPPDAGLEGKPLRITVRDCAADQVRIGLKVADDASRTLIVTRTADGLSLKHDVRDAKGAPAALSDYGGQTTSPGSDGHQEFYADKGSKTVMMSYNVGYLQDTVWTLEIDPGRRLYYATARPNYRSRIEFDLAKPLPEEAKQKADKY